MKNYVYIITKEGRIYSNEGVHYILTQLFSEQAENNSIVEMGELYNSPLILRRNILKNISNSFVIISNDENILCIAGEANITELSKLLEENEDVNSWELCNQFIGGKSNE